MRWLALVLIFLPAGLSAATTATSSNDELSAYLANDFKLYSLWISDQYAKSVGGLSGSHLSEPPAAVGGWKHFEAGAQLALSSSKYDTEALKDMKNLKVFSGTELARTQAPEMKVPVATGRVHAGLPGILLFEDTDIGVTGGGFDYRGTGAQITYSTLGCEFRGNLLKEGPDSSFTMQLGLSLDYTSARLAFSGSYSSTSIDSTGAFVQQSSNTLEVASDIKDTAVGAKALVSRRFRFLRPYLGAGLTVHSGNADTTLNVNGQVASTPVGGGATTVETFTATGSGSSPVPVVDSRLMAGTLIHIKKAYVSLGGEWGIASDTWAAHLGAGLWF